MKKTQKIHKSAGAIYPVLIFLLSVCSIFAAAKERAKHPMLTQATSVTVPGPHAESDSGNSVDIAWDGRTFKLDLIPDGKQGGFGGAHFIISGIVYPGGTLTTNSCQIIDSCGWSNQGGSLQPEFPDKVIGRLTTTGWFLPVDYIDLLLNAITTGDANTFVAQYIAERGKATAQVTHVLELAPDHQLTNRMIVAVGMTGTILPGETLLVPVAGGTGPFKHIGGEAVMTMITLINGSGAQTFNLKYPVDLQRGK